MKMKQLKAIILILLFILITPASAIQLNDSNGLKQEGIIQNNYIKTDGQTTSLKNDSQIHIPQYNNNLQDNIPYSSDPSIYRLNPDNPVWGNNSTINNWARNHPWAMVAITCAAATIISLSFVGIFQFLKYSIRRMRTPPTVEMDRLHIGETDPLLEAVDVSGETHQSNTRHSIRRNVVFDDSSIDPRSGGIVGKFEDQPSNRMRGRIKRILPTIQGQAELELNKPEIGAAVNRLLTEPDLQPGVATTTDVMHSVYVSPTGALMTDTVDTSPLGPVLTAEGTAQKIVQGAPRTVFEVATVPMPSTESAFMSVETALDTLNSHTGSLAQINPLYDRVSKIFTKISKYPQQFLDELFIGPEDKRLYNIPNYQESMSPRSKLFNLRDLGSDSVNELSQDVFSHETHLQESSKQNLAQALDNFGRKLQNHDNIFRVDANGLNVVDGRLNVVRTSHEHYFETKRGGTHLGNHVRTAIFKINAELAEGTLPLGEIQLIEILQSPMMEVMFPDGERGIMPDVMSLKRVMSYEEIFNQKGITVKAPEISSPPKHQLGVIPSLPNFNEVDLDTAPSLPIEYNHICGRMEDVPLWEVEERSDSGEESTKPTARSIKPGSSGHEHPTTSTTTTTTTTTTPTTVNRPMTDIPISEAQWSYTPRIIGDNDIPTLTLTKKQWAEIITNMESHEIVSDRRLLDAFSDPNLQSIGHTSEIPTGGYRGSSISTVEWERLVENVHPSISKFMEQQFGWVVSSVLDLNTMEARSDHVKVIQFKDGVNHMFQVVYDMKDTTYTVLIRHVPQMGVHHGATLHVRDHRWKIQILENGQTLGKTISKFELKEFASGDKLRRAVFRINGGIMEGANMGAPSFEPKSLTSLHY